MKKDVILTGISYIKLRVLVLLLSLFIIGSSCAQTTEKGMIRNNAGFTPVMKITNLNSSETDPMKIDELKIDVKVVGQLAVTTMEFTYLNTNNRIMEGEFVFPLAEGQTITRFALDINGTIREGVVVEKEEGRKTFEAIVRKGIDPGLLEKTEGNNFRARIYPLPAKGKRRIIIAYEQELSSKGKGYLYQLPLNIKNVIRSFAVHAEVIKQEADSKIGENELATFEFKHWNDSYTADYKMENYTPTKQLAFMIPGQTGKPQCFTEPISNGSLSSYFYITLNPKQFNQGKALPKKIVILWDNSNSCNGKEINKELAFLEGYIQKTGNVKIELVPFNIKTENSQSFNIINGNWNDLKNKLLNMVYDGATSLGNIDFTKYKCDEILLFSDGLSNFGLSKPGNSKVPVITINSNIIANHSSLKSIAQNNNGQYINLEKLTIRESIELVSASNYHYISSEIVEGNISEIYPSTGTQIHNTFNLRGIINGSSAILSLNFGFGNTIVHTEKVIISPEKINSYGMLQRMWAQKKIESLSIDEEANKDIITNLGKEFGIVTSNTSFIVLENLNDYLQYHIIPPKEMQDEYFRNINQDKKLSRDKINSQLDYVAGLFNSRIKWWNTNFPLVPYPVKMYKKGRSNTITNDSVYAEPETIVVAANDESVMMEERNSSAPSLEEIVVVGYGSERRAIEPGIALSTNDLRIEKDKQESQNKKTSLSSSIQLNAWDPETPYLKVLQYTPKGQEYTTYIKLKLEYGNTPFFYIDASDFFMKIGKNEEALKILSNLAELKLEEPQLLKILGNKLKAMHRPSESVDVFKKIIKIKGEDPQSYRDLGLAYEANGQFQDAIKTLYEVVKNDWNGRFPEIETIALEEINRIIANNKSNLDISFIDQRLIKSLPIDIRVVLTWYTDNCDMDLWVTDPRGEKCFYQHNNTIIGGIISNDFTQGYGPEEFLLKNAIQGEYTVQANYYGTRTQNTLAPVTLHLTFYTNYGKPNQQEKETTIRLENQKDVINIGKFTFVK